MFVDSNSDSNTEPQSLFLRKMRTYDKHKMSALQTGRTGGSFYILFNLQQAFMVRISALHIDLYLCHTCELTGFY